MPIADCFVLQRNSRMPPQDDLETMLAYRDYRHYAAYAQPIFAEFAAPKLVTKETDVAEAVWLAANDTGGQRRSPAGPDAVALRRQAEGPATLRRFRPGEERSYYARSHTLRGC